MCGKGYRVTEVGVGWIRVHGWWSEADARTEEPRLMLFQARHICGVYPAARDPTKTMVLFVNCEQLIHESVEAVWEMLGEWQILGREP